MKLKFKKYVVEKTVYDGDVTESVHINLGVIMNELLLTYKRKNGMRFDDFIIKLSDYKDDDGNPIQNDYFTNDLKKVLEHDVEYAIVKEWGESTPHGSIYRIQYEGEGTEIGYKIQTALKRIEEILNEEE